MTTHEYSTYKFQDLHRCFEEMQPVYTDERDIDKKDKAVLKDLGKCIADIAELPIQKKRQEQWKHMNMLEPGKPMVNIDEVCWHEMEVDEELRLRTSDPFCQHIEAQLRQTLYRWNHMQVDMIVEPVLYSPLAISNTGVGLYKEADICQTDTRNDVVSHHYKIQIADESDIDKLKIPEITHDERLSELIYTKYQDIFSGIIHSEKRGAAGFWFAPWDDIVMWTGVQEVLMDLAVRPEYIHALIDRLITIGLSVLDQYESLHLLALNNCNVRIGSGSYGYTDELPQSGYTQSHIRSIDLWGNATPQIFASVSPEMHKEFGIDYERRWMERFGLCYYGCCEPLHNKIEILRSIPNLRKISISPWADLEKAAERTDRNYVLSVKPNPAVFMENPWNPDHTRQELKTKLALVKKYNCQAEIVMKDISSVDYEPQRLWEWCRIASEVTAEYSD